MRQAGYSNPADPMPQKPQKGASQLEQSQYAADMVSCADRNTNKRNGNPQANGWEDIDSSKLTVEQTRWDLRWIYGKAELGKLKKNDPYTYEAVKSNPAELRRFHNVETSASKAKDLGKKVYNSDIVKAARDGIAEGTK